MIDYIHFLIQEYNKTRLMISACCEASGVFLPATKPLQLPSTITAAFLSRMLFITHLFITHAEVVSAYLVQSASCSALPPCQRMVPTSQ